MYPADVDIEEILRAEDRDVIDLLFCCRGVIYGGYLRDVIRGQPPTDLDVVLPSADFDHFCCELLKMGYQRGVDINHGTHVFTKPGAISIEAFDLDEDPETEWFGGLTDPDFDVNLLTYTRYRSRGLYLWTDASDPQPIIDHIRQGVAVPIEPLAERIVKMQSKGFMIIKA